MSEEDIHEANREAAEAAIDLAQLRDEKKQLVAYLNQRIQSLEKRVLTKANQAKTGTKEEDMSVWVHFDLSKETAVFYESQKMDGPVLGERPMTADEIDNPTIWSAGPDDEDLPFEDDEEAEEGVEDDDSGAEEPEPVTEESVGGKKS